MNDSPIEQLIQVRLRQAKDSLQEAETLYRSELYRGVINRAYYAMFYAVLRQASTSMHSGAIAFFDREFVKTGIFPKELSKTLHLAYQRRQETDYGEVLSVGEDEARQSLLEARDFVGKIIGFFENSKSG